MNMARNAAMESVVKAPAAGRARHAVLAACVFLGACGVAPTGGPQQASFDFGPAPLAAPAGARIAQPLMVADVTAPAWLDAPSVIYRLAYVNAAEPRSYAYSRWVMSPAALMTQRLRAAVAAATPGGVLSPSDGVRAETVLRVELEEFTHSFDAPQSSRAVVRLRASLVSNRALVAQRVISVSRPAAAHDAAGGAAALAAASDEAIVQLVGWVATAKR
jgi:cholesterol transport system auxiliary component